MLSLEWLYTDDTNNYDDNDDDNDDDDDDTNDDDNDTQRTNHDCIGSLACVPNEPKTSFVKDWDTNAEKGISLFNSSYLTVKLICIIMF